MILTWSEYNRKLLPRICVHFSELDLIVRMAFSWSPLNLLPKILELGTAIVRNGSLDPDNFNVDSIFSRCSLNIGYCNENDFILNEIRTTINIQKEIQNAFCINLHHDSAGFKLCATSICVLEVGNYLTMIKWHWSPMHFNSILENDLLVLLFQDDGQTCVIWKLNIMKIYFT